MTAEIVALAWRRFICRACGLIYDEAKGDADSGIAPGTRFDDIPDDWACPLCGVTKADFEPYVDVPIPRRAASRTTAARPVGAARRQPAIVIVGAGRAGWQMAAALRARDAALPIAIVTACSGDVYDKPLLSVAFAKRLAAGGIATERGADAAVRLSVRLLAHTQAVRVDAHASALRTTRGTLPFAHLVLAQGAAPREVAALPAALCWRINHLDAYRALRERLDAGRDDGGFAARHVVVAGAGLVGCELANDLALAGHTVTLLETAERPLATLLDAEASRTLLDAWRALPIRFEGGVRIEAVSMEGASRRIHLADGRTLDADHVVAATGLATPSRLAASAGLAWHEGIAVDALTLHTSVANIHALGDCISIAGRPQRYIEPIARQARRIAATIAGDDTPEPYDAVRPPIRVKTTSHPFTIH